MPAAIAAESAPPPEDHPLLEQARRNVEDVTRQLSAARDDREGAEAALAAVDARLVEVEEAVNDAAAAVARQELEVEVAGDRLDALRAEVDALEERLEERSVRMYMGAASGGVEGLLAAADVRDAVDRSSYLDLISETDATSLETAESARRALAGAADRFDEETARLEGMRVEQEQLLADVEELRRTRATALDDAELDVEDLEHQEDDLAGDYDRIADLISRGAATSAAASPPSSAGYAWPMCTELNSRFGYRWGRLHKGVDLDGDIGDPIAAAKAGTVITAGYEGGYGNLVLIDHGDGIVTAYGHQSELLVATGMQVERGELIGLVGNTGHSTGPHLHFETRVNGSAIDPLDYLPGSC